MRLFVAAELPQDMTDALAETSAALRDAVRGRYVAPDSWHVTLAFLGEVPGHRVPDAAEAIARACAGHGPVLASLGALGSFGRARNATLWQALVGGEALASLALDVRGELHDAGFSMDEKDFLSHVTLMRGADLTRGELPMPVLARGTLDTVTLYKSDLTGEHPRYTALERITLGS